MRNVGIGEPKILRGIPVGAGSTRAERPELAGPAFRARGSALDAKPVFGAKVRGDLGGNRSGGVFALVVNDHDMEFSGVVLMKQAGDRAADSFFLIARGDDGYDAWPIGRRENFFPIDRTNPPEPSSSEEKMQPDSENRRTDNSSRLEMKGSPHRVGSIVTSIWRYSSKFQACRGV